MAVHLTLEHVAPDAQRPLPEILPARVEAIEDHVECRGRGLAPWPAVQPLEARDQRGVEHGHLAIEDQRPGRERPRGLHPDMVTVVGLATEQYTAGLGFSFDLAYLHVPEWTPAQQALMERMQSELGYFARPRERRLSEDEYPQAK